jgi:hypothetical protein
VSVRSRVADVGGGAAGADRTRRLLLPLGVGGAVLAATTYVALVDPGVSGHYPTCPLKALTGLDCPACGGLRSVHALTHGDLIGAIDHNALVALLLVPVCVLLWLRWVGRSWRDGDTAGAQRDMAPSTDAAGEPVVAPAALAAPPAFAAPPATSTTARTVLWSVVALVVAFTVLRNVGGVPAFAWLGSSVG